MTESNGIYENIYYKKVKTTEKEPSKDLLKQTQEKVDELVEILHDNVDKAAKRGDNLSDLNTISENLERQAGEFKTQTVVIKRKAWRKHMKTKLVLAGVAAVVLLILTLVLLHALKVL